MRGVRPGENWCQKWNGQVSIGLRKRRRQLKKKKKSRLSERTGGGGIETVRKGPSEHELVSALAKKKINQP